MGHQAISADREYLVAHDDAPSNGWLAAELFFNERFMVNEPTDGKAVISTDIVELKANPSCLVVVGLKGNHQQIQWRPEREGVVVVDGFA